MQEKFSPKAVVLFSGGLDSITCAAIAKSMGFEVFALSFYYHQRHKIEIEMAKRAAAVLGIKEHLVLDLPLDRIGGSALTGDLEVPKDIPVEAMQSRIPVTYVPARNTIFLSFALAWAEVLGAQDIFIGVNALDYSGYPDCRPEFIDAFRQVANLGTKEGVEGRLQFTIHTPLIAFSKSQIIQRGTELGIDYSITHSCYDPDEQGRACGSCDSCLLRKKGFAEAGLPDPTVYAANHR
ncbi:MAG: 7-cyano-7-deazaguanine synthase QueC [Desulforhabdus sp.]|jgi:7-cyano-7-deazaguanine synthase|nr:7-cyano-7-deazaguanine synthase QueC [Desulforhabdus sp.]